MVIPFNSISLLSLCFAFELEYSLAVISRIPLTDVYPLSLSNNMLFFPYFQLAHDDRQEFVYPKVACPQKELTKHTAT